MTPYSLKNISCSCSFPLYWLFLLLYCFRGDVCSDYTKCLSLFFTKKILIWTAVLDSLKYCHFSWSAFCQTLYPCSFRIACHLPSFNTAHPLPASTRPTPPCAVSHPTFSCSSVALSSFSYFFFFINSSFSVFFPQLPVPSPQPLPHYFVCTVLAVSLILLL